ncbi:hypothetical protein N9Z47_00535 [bacterium]|nr:hypothetical protein [bacterium]
MLTALLFLLGVGASETFFRYLGFEPSLRDTRNFWALHRARVDKADTSKQVATLGASRVQTGFCPRLFQAQFPEAEMVGLHIDGSSFVPVLHDIATNTNFRGTLICSFHSSLLSNDTKNMSEFSGKQYEYVSFYHKLHSNAGWYNTRANTAFDMEWQKRLVTGGLPPGRFLSTLAQVVKGRREDCTQCFVFNENRYRRADYRAQVAPAKLEEYRRVRTRHYAKVMAMPDETDEELIDRRELWMDSIRKLWDWATQIENRGGRVVFVCFPISGKLWEIEEKQYPKDYFWSHAAKQSPIEMIHFHEIPGAAAFECPDASHLNYDDAEQFTKMLAEQLKRRRVVPYSFNGQTR